MEVLLYLEQNDEQGWKSIVKITIYNEYRHEQEDEAIRAVYPEGIHGCLSKFLNQNEEIEVRHIATFDMPEHGLCENVLHDTDVLVFWSHMLQEEFSDEVARRVQKHVQAGMGLVALHSAHYSKVLRFLLGTTMTLRWHHGEQERLIVTSPSHPIAQGIPERFDLAKEEMYGEYFDIPKPDDVVFTGWFSGGEVFRSGVTFTRGRGRIFYFQPGHEEYPIYENPIIQRIITNGVLWCGKREGLIDKIYSNWMVCNEEIKAMRSAVKNNEEINTLRTPMDNKEVRRDGPKISAFFDHVLEAGEQSGKSLSEILGDMRKADIRGLEMRLSHLLEREEEVAGLLAENDLKVSCIYEMYDWAIKPDFSEAMVQVDKAAQYGAKVILVVPGFLPEEEAGRLKALHARQDIWQFMDENRYVQNIKDELTGIVNYAKERGITVTLEDFDGFTAPFSRAEELLYFMNRVPGLMYTLDMGNFAYSDENVWDAYTLLQEYIVHVHCKDRGEEPDCSENTYNRGLATVPVGEGYLPIGALEEKLATKGYDGYLAIEHFGSSDQFTYLLDSAAYLKSLMEH